MKKTTIITIVIGIILAAGVCMGVSSYFSLNNQEIALRSQAEAQRGKVEGVYDAMWKIISQKAQVSDQYKEAFKEIYPDLIAGRYEGENGTLMKWIQESNPEFDTSLYRDLMQSIEVERHAFMRSQERMLDIIREHSTLCHSYPGAWFIKNTGEIEYTVISSTKAKETMTTGIDDDTELFQKKETPDTTAANR